MNRPLLTLKGRKPSDKPVAASPVISSVVVARKKRYVVEVAPPKPVEVAKPKPQPKTPKKPKVIPPPKPLPLPIIPRFVRVATTLTALRETWPLLFDETDPPLWEVGIRKKFWKGMNKKHSRALIAEALQLWQQLHPEYHQKLKIVGNPRLGIDGTVTMTVTEEHAQRAIENY
jgi:hypothetical protein